jgi:hypothetical protein
MREYHRRAKDWLIQQGASGVRIIRSATGRGHPRIVFTHAGRVYSHTIAYSPSCHRASKNMIAQLRRKIIRGQ